MLSSLLASSQNTVCLTIEPNPNPSNPALSPFTKYGLDLKNKQETKAFPIVVQELTHQMVLWHFIILKMT